MKRSEPIGTRRLTDRSMRAAFNASRKVVKTDMGIVNDPTSEWLHEDGQGEQKWPAIRDFGREVENRVAKHQMAQTYKLAVKIVGKKAADKLHRAWTLIRGD